MNDNDIEGSDYDDCNDNVYYNKSDDDVDDSENVECIYQTNL